MISGRYSQISSTSDVQIPFDEISNSIFSLFDFFPLQSEGPSGGNRTSTTMPRGMHVHLLDFNEHVHSEDSMPRGAHALPEGARVVSNKKSLEKKESKRND